jgi:type IV fimbrial biogenesis protein FimT
MTPYAAGMDYSLRRQPGAGHTMLEMLMVLALLATISAVTAPPLGRLLGRHAVSAELGHLERAFYRARQAATRRGRPVIVCASTDGARCGGDWSRGWIAFVNDDGDVPPQRDPNETRLLRHRPDTRVRLTANRSAFRVRADWHRSTNGTLLACDAAGRIAPRGLIVSYTGRPRHVSGTRLPAGAVCP